MANEFIYSAGGSHRPEKGIDNLELIRKIYYGLDIHSANVNIAYNLGIDLEKDPGAIKREYNNLRDGIKNLTYASI